MIFRSFTVTKPTNIYYFYIDFKGLLYFDDSTSFIFPNCIKDTKFIHQMYKHLKIVPTNLIKDNYKYYAQFWGEINYLRCAISPIIFNLMNPDSELQFSLNMKCQFDPNKLEIDQQGRIWHPFRDKIKGVFSNELTAQFLDDIYYEKERTFLKYLGREYEIKLNSKME